VSMVRQAHHIGSASLDPARDKSLATWERRERREHCLAAEEALAWSPNGDEVVDFMRRRDVDE
jgi:hypothetical protein